MNRQQFVDAVKNAIESSGGKMTVDKYVFWRDGYTSDFSYSDPQHARIICGCNGAKVNIHYNDPCAIIVRGGRRKTFESQKQLASFLIDIVDESQIKVERGISRSGDVTVFIKIMSPFIKKIKLLNDINIYRICRDDTNVGMIYHNTKTNKIRIRISNKLSPWLNPQTALERLSSNLPWLSKALSDPELKCE